MRKLTATLLSLSVISLSLLSAPKAHAGDCAEPVTDVADYTVQIITGVNFRESIQGSEEDNCPENEPIGAFAPGQILWVLGEIETGLPNEDEEGEYYSWLYVKHPTTGDYGFVWGEFAKKVPTPDNETDHQEEVVKDVTGLGVNADSNEETNEENTEEINNPETTEANGNTTTPEETTEESNAEENNTTLPDIVGHQYEKAIRFLEAQGTIEGYPDGFFKPDLAISRDEFTKIIVGAKLNGVEPTESAADCFPDMKADNWAASYVCYAKDQGYLHGYPDGNFKPELEINLVEAAKILVNVLAVPAEAETELWYESYMNALQDKNYIPDTFSQLDQKVSRAQMSEMVWRILNTITDQAAIKFSFEQENTEELVQVDEKITACVDDHLPSNIDMNKVRNTWLEWHNKVRTENGVEPMTLQDGLNYSATIWAKSNLASGNISHKRGEGVKIQDWFKETGITFSTDYEKIEIGENLGLKTYACSEADCTDEVIQEIEAVFNAFMAEQDALNSEHFQNIVSDKHLQLGLGMAIDENNNLIYLTTHYAQEVNDYPETCQ